MNPVLREMQKGGSINHFEVNSIFRNLREIYQVNLAFFKDFGSLRSKEWPIVQSIGKTMVDHV